MTHDQLVIWAAGFFDGEGSIAIRRVKRSSGFIYHLRIHVSQKGVEPLQRFEHIFGGIVLNTLGSKRARSWEAQGPGAARALEKMLPYLTVKKEQAVIALAFQSRPWRGKIKTTKQLQQDEGDWLAIREERARALVEANGNENKGSDFASYDRRS
jgi:hypothetical protein